MSTSKNLGQVAGVSVGTTAPTNLNLIWYDSTPTQMKHKVYDQGTSQWIVLNQNIINSVTYSEVVALATGTGLTILSWFKITDKGNVLALAITSTKIQYVDTVGNIVIDDLGANSQYHVTSDNLLIDDVAGVFDTINKKLVFTFSEQSTLLMSDNDYFLGKSKISNVWTLVKYKINKLLSSSNGNSIVWNNGLFFNFTSAISNILDKTGGVVSKEAFDSEISLLNTSVDNVGTQNQQIINNAKEYTDSQVTNAVIYNKNLPSDLDTTSTPIDIVKGDTVISIFSKIQRWINKFKVATGITVSTDFAQAATKTPINNNDTVDSALRKVAKYLAVLTAQTGTQILSSDNTDWNQFTAKPADPVAVGKISENLLKIWYFSTHLDNDYIPDGEITYPKLFKYGISPTDIFRLELSSGFDFSNCGFGGCVYQGDGFLFQYDSNYPYNPYRLTTYFDDTYPKILGFAPVIPVVVNSNQTYYNAGSLIHYIDSDITIQFILSISKTTYDALYSQGYRYLQCVASADVYNSQTDSQTWYVALNQITYGNMTITKSRLNMGGMQHIIMKLSVTPSVSNS